MSKFETKLYSSKVFPAEISTFNIGKYYIQSIPSDTLNRYEAILSFEDTFIESESSGSHPEEESNIICRFLSLVYNMKVKRSGIRINGINVITKQQIN
jgi:hypothetical protein